MDRLVALGAIFLVSVYHSAAEDFGAVVVDDGRVGIGIITGGNFEAGSFSIGAPGQSRPKQIPVIPQNPQMPITVNEGSNGQVHILVQVPHKRKEDEDYDYPTKPGKDDEPKAGGKNTRRNRIKPKRRRTNTAQGGRGSERGNNGGQKNIAVVVLTGNQNNEGNRKKNSNMPDTNAPGKNLLDETYSNGDGIKIDSINEGNFESGSFSLNSNIRPREKAPKKPIANNGNAQNDDANDPVLAIGHGTNTNGHGNGEDGYNQGSVNSGYKPGPGDDKWIWS